MCPIYMYAMSSVLHCIAERAEDRRRKNVLHSILMRTDFPKPTV